MNSDAKKVDILNAEINYSLWRQVVTKTQIILVILAFLTELVGNFMLYQTRSQGYGPDTIVEKLIRYLLLTTLFNIAIYILGQLIVSKSKNLIIQKYTLIMSTQVICINIGYSHYQFADIFLMFMLAIIVSIVYEDIVLTRWTTVVGLAGFAISVYKRATDPLYNTDIGPEAAIAFSIIIAVCMYSNTIINTLNERRDKLRKALESAQRTAYLEKVQQMSVQMLEALARAIDAKDTYTNGHSYRVSEYSIRLAKELGYSNDEIEELRQEALLHDIGKISVPDSVLNKPSRLTDVEFKVMKFHTTAGADILRNFMILPNAMSVADGHHERFDGKGYPNGVKGKATHDHARIVCIADAYDAMNSDRIYRKALDKNTIRKELVKGRGTQFDPDYLDLFLKLFDDGQLELDSTHSNISDEKYNNISVVTDSLLEFVDRLNSKEKHDGAMEVSYHNFSDIYEFMKQLKARYHHSFELVMFTTKPLSDDDVDAEELAVVSEAMEMAIKKNIRAVDIYTRCNYLQHLAVLNNAGANNIDMIVQRIILDFYKLCDSKKFEVYYEVSENE